MFFRLWAKRWIRGKAVSRLLWKKSIGLLNNSSVFLKHNFLQKTTRKFSSLDRNSCLVGKSCPIIDFVFCCVARVWHRTNFSDDSVRVLPIDSKENAKRLLLIGFRSRPLHWHVYCAPLPTIAHHCQNAPTINTK